MTKKIHKQKEIDSSTKKKYISISAIAIFMIIAIPFCMGKYCELNTPGPFDSGSYVYSAQHILNGAVIGTGELPSAQSGTLLMNMLGVWLFGLFGMGFSDIGPKVIQGALQASALGLTYYALKQLYSRSAAFIATLTACFYLSAPVIAKFGNVKEQFMIAFMMLGISSFILRLKKEHWLWGLLAGMFLSWGPLFKQTGISAIGAVAIFLIVAAILKLRTVKIIMNDIALLLLGAAIALSPVYAWIIIGDLSLTMPYGFVWDIFANLYTKLFSAKEATKSGESILPSGYVQQSRSGIDLAAQAKFVFGYYRMLSLPIAMAITSILIVKIRIFFVWFRRKEKPAIDLRESVVFLLATWWLLDMVFVWISPRPYEQYYLPLCASGSIAGAYSIWILGKKTCESLPENKMLWRSLYAIVALIMIVLAWPIMFGLTKSPYSGKEYKDREGNPHRERGYLQKLKDANSHRKGNLAQWEIVGEYINKHSSKEDSIYVWGWVPGIYVKAQRFAPVPKAFESNMHVMKPEALGRKIRKMVKEFKKNPPKYIVDSRKIHFPNDRPPLELWPSTSRGFLPNNDKIVAYYNSAYENSLKESIGKGEDLRFKAMQPLRDFIRENYSIVDADKYRFSRSFIYNNTFGIQVVFKLEKKLAN